MDRNITSFNMDGREFLREMMDRSGVTTSSSPSPSPSSSSSSTSSSSPYSSSQKYPLPSHIVMNLPALALEFLDSFKYRDFRRALDIALSSLSPSVIDQAKDISHSSSSSSSSSSSPSPTTLSSSTSPSSSNPLPSQIRVHCYCFSSDENDPKGDVLNRASQILGEDLRLEEWRSDVFIVRDVAPQKLMLCLSFDLLRGLGVTMRETFPSLFSVNTSTASLCKMNESAKSRKRKREEKTEKDAKEKEEEKEEEKD